MAEDVCEYLSVNEEKVFRIRKLLGLENTAERIAEVFKILSDPSRLKIIQALELEELCVCDIASLIGISQPSVSHHLKGLRQCGLVKFRKSGKMVLYSLKGGRVSALMAVARDYARE